MLRVCRKERYSHTEIDYLFYSIVPPDITYGLSVYGASVADINVLQQFLDRCYKGRTIRKLMAGVGGRAKYKKKIRAREN